MLLFQVQVIITSTGDYYRYRYLLQVQVIITSTGDYYRYR